MSRTLSSPLPGIALLICESDVLDNKDLKALRFVDRAFQDAASKRLFSVLTLSFQLDITSPLGAKPTAMRRLKWFRHLPRSLEKLTISLPADSNVTTGFKTFCEKMARRFFGHCWKVRVLEIKTTNRLSCKLNVQNLSRTLESCKRLRVRRFEGVSSWHMAFAFEKFGKLNSLKLLPPENYYHLEDIVKVIKNNAELDRFDPCQGGGCEIRGGLVGVGVGTIFDGFREETSITSLRVCVRHLPTTAQAVKCLPRLETLVVKSNHRKCHFQNDERDLQERDEAWAVLRAAGIQLKHITAPALSRGLLGYLRYTSSALESLSLSCGGDDTGAEYGLSPYHSDGLRLGGLPETSLLETFQTFTLRNLRTIILPIWFGHFIEEYAGFHYSRPNMPYLLSYFVPKREDGPEALCGFRRIMALLQRFPGLESALFISCVDNRGTAEPETCAALFGKVVGAAESWEHAREDSRNPERLWNECLNFHLEWRYYQPYSQQRRLTTYEPTSKTARFVLVLEGGEEIWRLRRVN